MKSRIREIRTSGSVGGPVGQLAGLSRDYKSGTILEVDADGEHEAVKASYVRQLQIYAYLVKESVGRWPGRGTLLPVIGVGVAITLDPAKCEEEARAAVELLDQYNAAVAVGTAPVELASPSPLSCKWCPFKMICPAFWLAASPAWSGKLDGAAVEGVLKENPHEVYAGAAVSLTLELKAGTEPAGSIVVGPFNKDVYASVGLLRAGDRIRVVGLRHRKEGGLFVGHRTVLASHRDLPTLETDAGAHPS